MAARTDKMPFMDGHKLTWATCCPFFTDHTIAFDSEQKNSN